MALRCKPNALRLTVLHFLPAASRIDSDGGLVSKEPVCHPDPA
jgi:hypothetical protein